MSIRTKIASVAGRLVTGRVLVVVATLMVAAAGWASWATWQMERLQKEAGRCAEVERIAVQNEQAVVAVAERLSRCVNQTALDLEAERRATETLEDELRAIREAENRERSLRDGIYQADQACDAWRNRTVCRPIGRRLYESAESIATDPGRSADAGSAEDSGQSSRTDNGSE